MREACKNAAKLLLLAARILQIFGKVVVLRGYEEYNSRSYNTRKLVCMSNEDGNALVWNTNLIWKYSSYEFRDRETDMTPQHFFNCEDFYANKNPLNCKLYTIDSCMASWTAENWRLVNSLNVPMGPVFDSRWEEFTEYNNFRALGTFYLTHKLRRTGVLVFSVRGKSDAHVALCNAENTASSFCYWIIIGGWGNTRSVLRKCAYGLPLIYPEEGSECKEEKVKYYHSALTATEWRTFVLSWQENDRSVELHDTEKRLFRYVDTGDVSLNSNNIYYLFVRSPNSMLYRFHLYNYLHTSNVNAVLSSPSVYAKDANICLQLVVGLCAHCSMEITLVDVENPSLTQELMVLTGSKLARDHGLPMWQNVKINATIAEDFGDYVQFRFVPKLERDVEDASWAIANVHECPAEDVVTVAAMRATQDYENYKYYWPNVTCQKFSYDEDHVVSSVADVTFDFKPDDYYCPNGRTGLHCVIDCKANLNLNQDCLRGVICEESGCTCSPGFHGNSCERYCGKGKYGFGCAESCDNCTSRNCNYITGECINGCDNSRAYHIPPFCRTGIMLPSPQIDLLSETSAQVSLVAKDEYKMIPSSYYFSIEPEKSPSENRDTIIYKNTTELVRRFDELEPGTVYNVRATLLVENAHFQIHSPEITFTTPCNPSTTFEVTPYETSLVLNNILQSQTAYPCPAKWYAVVIEEIPLGITIRPKEMREFPQEFTGLTPFTKYNVKVYRSNVTFVNKEIVTLAGAPTQVQYLRNTSLSSTHVTVQWNKPKRENGIITKYVVNLEVYRYLGCENSKRDKKDDFTTSANDTTITLTSLHPYTTYIVSVSAHTSKPGQTDQIYVTTYPRDTPTAVVSKLRFQGNTLSWSDPADCKTISGPIYGTKIILDGISNHVKTFHDEQNTFHRSFKLSEANQMIYGAETYRARVYVMRQFSMRYNESAYAEEIFTTPPKAPPAVRDFECFEIDSESKTTSLRWKEPQPPVNGQVEYYTVAFTDKNGWSRYAAVTVPTNQACSLWEDYICAYVQQPKRVYSQIAIWANNKNVSEEGDKKFLKDDRIEFAPTAPSEFNLEVLSGAVIQLTWSHPWKTGGPLMVFLINVELTSTKLKGAKSFVRQTIVHKYAVSKYQPRYTDRLYLQPSCNYTFIIFAKTKFKTSQAITAEARTPSSLAFGGDFKWEMYAPDSTIRLDLPTVLNDTESSVMYVIVAGPRPCEQYSKVGKVLSQQAGLLYYETAWIAGILSTSEYSGETFTVGDNKIYDGATNCLLYARESYVVIVVVQSEKGSIVDQVLVARTTSIHIGDVPPVRPEAWLIPIFVIIAVAVAVFFLWRRRRRSPAVEVMITDEMSLSQHGNYEDESIPSSPYEIKKPLESIKCKKQDSLSRGGTPDILQSPIIMDEKENSSSLVKVKDFQDYVRDAIQTGLLDRQYEIFPRGPTKPCEYGKHPQNKSKNRYANLIAYDETRVVLEKLPDNPYSDYINANYIQGYKKEKCYIATQGPKASTVIDFWRMIWQEEVLVICMLANVIESGKTKCEQYWPDIGKKKKYGDVIVLNAKHSVFADYTFRIWHVTRGQETRKIEHLHYTAWPDHGVPLYTHSVVTYLKKLLATPAGNGPVVVHCSAGVGRTGTIILCDICLRRAAAEGVVDVLAETRVIRSQRANMVDNKQQYLLAHLALVECLLSLPTALPCNESLPSKIKDLKQQLVAQLQRLQDTAWQDEALRPSGATQPLSESNIAKNRFPELITEKASRVYIKRHPPHVEDSDYISAVYVDGVKLQNQYLASQLPMPNTLSDFWRMIAEFKVELIIMLQPPDPEDPTCCAVAPECGEFKPTSYINVTTEEATTMEHYRRQKATLVDNSEKPPRKQPVTILSSTEWKPGRKRDPPSTVALITLWQAAEKISRGDGPTVTLCHDGVTACGLFLALSFLLERMAVERECDVCLAVRAVRRSRPDFIQSLEQLEYLYDSAVTYLQYFETYANFS